MSDRKYEREWRAAEAEVGRLVADDRLYLAEDVVEDRPRAYAQAASNYVRYCVCVNRLGECLDQIVHVQKRTTVRSLLDATTARLLQVKRELVNQDSSDFNYLDGVLVDMRLTPWDVELKVPACYRRDRAATVAKQNEQIDRILYDMENPPPEEGEEGGESAEGEANSKKDDKEETNSKVKTVTEIVNPNRPPKFKVVEITESQKLFKEAIQLIQRHERARVSRVATQELREKQRTQHDIAWQLHRPIEESVLQRSVQMIQRFWRGYAKRHRDWHHRTQNRLLMGELTPSWRAGDEGKRAADVAKGRRRRQQEADLEYERRLEELDRAVRRRDWRAEEDIADHLRWYIEHWYRIVGELPAFPKPQPIPEPTDLLGFPQDTPAEFLKRHAVVAVPTSAECCPGLDRATVLGGSALIVAGHWIDPWLYELAHNAARLARGKDKPGAKKKEKLSKQELKELKEEEKEKKRLEAEAKKKELEEKWKRGVVPEPTELLEPLERRLEQSRIEWGEQGELEGEGGIRDDLPRAVMACDRQRELREIVDDLMRMEIDRLQAALNRDRGKKAKGGDKKKKNKKGKKGKKGKKDPTADRTTESLFRELVENGIIRKTPDVTIDSIFCEPSWNAYELRRDPWWKDPAPNLWDVKQVVKEYCVLGLGSAEVHRRAPLVRSVLLAGGHPECGQRALADAVAAEAGATLFDLSPATGVASRYPGKKGLNMLVHLVNKMTRVLQPSVVLVEGGEKPFYKKVPKPERPLNPKLLKKQLPKMVRAVTADDRVLFLATSDAPWAGQAKAMARTYNRILPVLPPDRSTATLYWHRRLMGGSLGHGVDRDSPYQPLAWCAPGYTLPAIDRALAAVLVPQRVVQLKYRPLDPQELMDELLKEPPYTEEQVEKLLEWHRTTYPLARARAERIKADTELREKLAAIEAKKKEQQKKKKKS